MNTKNSRLYTKVYRGGVLLAGILLAFSVLSGCKDASDSEGGTAGSGGSGNSSQYTKVAYENLATYLASASSTEVNYIEITGTIPAADLIGTFDTGEDVAKHGELGKRLKDSGKKIALKLPANIAPGTSMEYCFGGCTNLVSVENIPSGVVNMKGSFEGCTELTGVPSIPSGVTTMQSCFRKCTSLTTAPAVPGSVTTLSFCFAECTELKNAPVVSAAVNKMSQCFKGCSKLTAVTLKCNYVSGEFLLTFDACNALLAGSITVPQGTLTAYTGAASGMGTTADKFKEAAD
ncbi:leucine-rich repeat protein [Treponema socranskii]|uniref:leucine-rich repeat protein n=1 Tax=Treponema socranskii TaxID=53419 RepID=UPI003D92EC42